MAAPRTGPCSDWATEASLCEPCSDYSFDAGVIADALTAASEYLFMRSGRRFAGACTDTVRPCTRSSVHTVRTWGDQDGTTPRVVCGCNRGRRCGCTRLSEITLGGYPVTNIDQIRVRDTVGGTLETYTAADDGTEFRIDDYRWLVRLPEADGTRRYWPCCQSLEYDAGDGEVFFEVTFDYGSDPPQIGVAAAAELACELALACDPSTLGECRLPKRATRVARQNVDVDLRRIVDFLTERKTGLDTVDLFLDAYNPHNLQKPATVLWPERRRRVRRAGT